MTKTFEQNDKTKEFVKEVKTLVENGIEPSYKAIADKLSWHNNAMSLVLNGSRNVPAEVFKKYTEIYKGEKPHSSTNVNNGVDYRDRYIAILEQQLEEKNKRLEAIEDKIMKYLSSETAEAYFQSLLALANTTLDELLDHRSALEKKEVKTLKKAADKRYDAYRLSMIDSGK